MRNRGGKEGEGKKEGSKKKKKKNRGFVRSNSEIGLIEEAFRSWVRKLV